jgi:hypothetical protein
MNDRLHCGKAASGFAVGSLRNRSQEQQSARNFKIISLSGGRRRGRDGDGALGWTSYPIGHGPKVQRFPERRVSERGD